MAREGEYRIINFHGIGEPRRELEPGEADYWLSRDRFLTIIDRISSHPQRERVSITFDDGNASDLLIAAPELRRRGLRAEFFILTGRIGHPGSLASDDIGALTAMGMRIGSHGVDHKDWTKIPTPALRHELEASRTRLQEICGVDVQSASLPFGWYNSAVLLEIRRAGYIAAYSSSGGNAAPGSFLKPRTSIRFDTTDATLARILTGQMPIWRSVRSEVRARFRI